MLGFPGRQTGTHSRSQQGVLMWLGRVRGVSAGPLEGQGEDEPSCRFAEHQRKLRERQNQSPRPAANRSSERKRELLGSRETTGSARESWDDRYLGAPGA